MRRGRLAACRAALAVLALALGGAGAAHYPRAKQLAGGPEGFDGVSVQGPAKTARPVGRRGVSVNMWLQNHAPEVGQEAGVVLELACPPALECGQIRALGSVSFASANGNVTGLVNLTGGALPAPVAFEARETGPLRVSTTVSARAWPAPLGTAG